MPRRHANGEGTLYRRKDGRWEGAVYVLTTSGAHKRFRVYGRTRSDVHRKLTEAKARQQRGIPSPDKAWRLGEYLDHWLEHVIRPNLRATTYERYESNVRLTLQPTLGHHLISRLTVPIVQRCLNELQNQGKSRRQVQMAREVLSSALTSAMRDEIVFRNVARLVVLPGRERQAITPWTVHEAVGFLESASNHWLYSALVLLLFYGLRRGEVLGLRWQDIDFSRGELRIEQQIFRAGGTVGVGPVKTNAGRRILPLLDSVRRLLLHRRRQQLPSSSGLVHVARGDDGPVDPVTLTESFYSICRRNGLRRIKLHHLRHTTATLLKNLHVPVRDIQLILGHAHISTTQQIYQHDDLDTRRDALEKLEGVLTESNSAAPHEQRTPGAPAAALPSLLPSNLISRINNQESTPDNEVLCMVTLPGIEKCSSSPSMSYVKRMTEVCSAVRTWRRSWPIGTAAVNLAVRTPEVDDVASPSPEDSLSFLGTRKKH